MWPTYINIYFSQLNPIIYNVFVMNPRYKKTTDTAGEPAIIVANPHHKNQNIFLWKCVLTKSVKDFVFGFVPLTSYYYAGLFYILGGIFIYMFCAI